MNEGFADLSQELYSVDEKAEKRSRSLEAKITAMDQRFEGIDTRFEAQDKKLDDILALLKGLRNGS